MSDLYTPDPTQFIKIIENEEIRAEDRQIRKITSQEPNYPQAGTQNINKRD
jgi:hypothetical protein